MLSQFDRCLLTACCHVGEKLAVSSRAYRRGQNLAVENDDTDSGTKGLGDFRLCDEKLRTFSEKFLCHGLKLRRFRDAPDPET